MAYTLKQAVREFDRGFQGDRNMARVANTAGIDDALFNCIFALITGHAASISKYNWSNYRSGMDQIWLQGLDVWDWEPGVRFFAWFLFDIGECPRFKKTTKVLYTRFKKQPKCCIICGKEKDGFESYHTECEVYDNED